MPFLGRSTVRGLAVALTFAAGGAAAALAQTPRGTITGTVREANTNLPIPLAQVTVNGSAVRVLTDNQGAYRITGVAEGRAIVRARVIGYKSGADTVLVQAGGEVTADFSLAASAVGLDEIIVTASGEEQAVRAQGNSVTKLNMDTVIATAPVTDMSDALDARAAGVEVMQSSGTTGSGTRIRIRGSNSVSISNEPAIYIDGVRVESGAISSTTGVGGQTPSRLNDIDPETIASVEVIRGPSAATLYGTDAANGVISIHTKRGHSGRATWRAYAETGSLNDVTRWPDNVFGFDSTKTNALRYGCTLPRESGGLCKQTGLFRLNPLMNNSPFRTGNHQQYGINVAGGGESTTYFLSADRTDETGIYPNNGVQRTNLQANINANVSPTVDVGVQGAYTHSDLRLPDNDNNALGYLGSGLLGNSDTTRHGWGFLTPDQVQLINTTQRIERFTGSATADYRPASFLTAHAVLGLDHTTRFDQRTIEPNQVFFNTGTINGSRIANPVQLYGVTADASATATFRLTPVVSSHTTVGTQYYDKQSLTVFASGQILSAGTSSLAGVVIPAVSEQNIESKTFGEYVEEQVGFNDRLFVTGALRRDENSSFGRSFAAIVYPKLQGSWVITEEPFFPSLPVISTLKLRASYGGSGQAPGAVDALQFNTPIAVNVAGSDVAGFSSGNLGNPNLKPERSTEFEQGFDAGLFHDSWHFSVTHYDKNTKDALVARPLATSLGDTTAQFYNLGLVNNHGWELSLDGRMLNGSGWSLDLNASAWTTKNTLLSLGTDFNGRPIAPIILNRADQQRAGFPLGAYFTKKIVSFNDANGDGIITPNEVTLDTAFSYAGTPFPTSGWTLNPTLNIGHTFRVSALFDHRGGNSLYNNTEQFRCQVGNCPELSDPKTPLARQAQVVSAVFLGQPNGFIEDASFTKLREISITAYLPASWAHMMRSDAVSVTVAGRNLHTWTKYSGADPEVAETGQNNFVTDDFLTQPPVRVWTFRLNYSF